MPVRFSGLNCASAIRIISAILEAVKRLTSVGILKRVDQTIKAGVKIRCTWNRLLKDKNAQDVTPTK